MAMVDVDDSSLPGNSQAKFRLGLRVGGHLALIVHLSSEPNKLALALP